MRTPSHSFCRLAASALAALASPLAGAAIAQQPAAMAAPACPATPEPLPPAFAAWPNATTLTSASDRPGLAAAKVAPGEAETLELHPAAEMHYALAPAKPAAAGSFGGMAALHVTAPGTYRVALSSGAWVDLLGNGQFLPSAGHGHGPACSGIRKIVDFALQPGDYVLQVAGSTAATITVLVVPQG
ncbi:homogentisate 1,2-dioxygenase [Novosphingobium pokkalii]|uniref:Homogentisate 1,2-dioxygenase n=2 Tax=Novosphingobium pokkalii TaxID=1770194 RepID=A0ABV7UZB4_9SPHN|nr:homogentisate 1,2-dioxygenase [Novosphingobium pokkalii]GHC87118.1 hypothetical protein GCM10019060_09130 [Novosphingobium pokkalii]